LIKFYQPIRSDKIIE